MDPLIEASKLGAFLPTKDFYLSRRFYEALGFTNQASDDEVALFETGAGTIILTHVSDENWDGAFMMALAVDDLAAWWERIASLDLPSRFGVDEPRAPEMQPWGLEVAYLVDPAGVLWHFQQRPDA